MKTKMIMTKTLADQLMGSLCCVAISANGDMPFDRKGNCLMTDTHIEKTLAYAQRIFYDILSEWENDGREWEIVER